jgi:hypothetical protein
METGVGSWELAGDVSLAAFGVGLTYYFMPANVYLSGSFGVGSIAMTEIYSNTSRDDVAVLAGEVAFGKEWWIGEDWGLGAALAVGYHFVPVDDDEDTRSGLSYGLRLSATMN